MSDLISRQAAIDAITAIDDGFNCDIYTNEVREILRELPSVPERKKGRWIHDGYDFFPHGIDWIHCSKCGKRWINIPADLPKYCPCCGARMEGAKDE